MSLQLDPRLEQARRLIENRQREEARTLLTSIIRSDPENVDALYLYAHVARTTQEAEAVLERILELAPSFNDARITLNKLRGRGSQSSGGGGGGGSSFLVLLLFLILVGLVAATAWILFIREDDREAEVVVTSTSTASPTLTHTPTETPGPTIDPTDLPITWTPEPSFTPAPTRTTAPTITIAPSLTPLATFTPTEIRVETVEPELSSLNRSYVVYSELAAQASAIEDIVALQQIQAALLAILQGIDESDLDEFPQETQDYLDNFKGLINAELNVASAREALLNLLVECEGQEDEDPCESDIEEAQAVVDRRRAAWLEQEDLVSVQLAGMSRVATATAQFENQIDLLKTPSVTPIVLD